VLDVIDRRRERPLVNGRDAPREFRRGHAGVLPDDADDRN
jgi:hypothetical protein